MISPLIFKYFVLIILICRLTHPFYAQTFILDNGEIIESSYTTFTNPVKGVPYFTFEEKRIEALSRIKYVADDSMRFRIKGLYKGSVRYLPRIKDGPVIDIYEEEYKKTKLSPFVIPGKNKVDYYFEKKEKELQKFNFSQLKSALEDKPHSMAILKKAKLFRWIEITSLALSAVAAVSVVQSEVSSFPTDMAALSVLSLVPVALVQKPKENIYFDAISDYNIP